MVALKGLGRLVEKGDCRIEPDADSGVVVLAMGAAVLLKCGIGGIWTLKSGVFSFAGLVALDVSASPAVSPAADEVGDPDGASIMGTSTADDMPGDVATVGIVSLANTGELALDRWSTGESISMAMWFARATTTCCFRRSSSSMRC